VVEHWVVISGTSLRRRASVITFESFRGSLLEFYYSLLFVIYAYAGFCPFLLLFILFYERIMSCCIDKEVHNFIDSISIYLHMWQDISVIDRAAEKFSTVAKRPPSIYIQERSIPGILQ